MASKNIKKILLACPVSKEKEYIIYKWLDHIKKFTYPYDILLVDNSRAENWYRTLKNKGRFNVEETKYRAGCSIVHVNTFGKNVFERMLKSYKLIENYFFENDYDYLFSLECDVFPPYDIIERLLAMDKPVACAGYFIGAMDDQLFMLQDIEGLSPLPPFETANQSLNESFLFCDGSVKQIFHAGLGCVMIKRSVLCKISFRLSDTEKNIHPDTFFCKDCFTESIPIFLDTSIIARHYNIPWNSLIKT